MDSLLRRLSEIVGPNHVLTDPEMVAGYCIDWTGRFQGKTPAVVRPGSTAEVGALVDVCRTEGVAIVPQGGNTGLVGGGVPTAGELVLSMRRLDSIGAVDRGSGQITVGAGVTLAAVHAAAASSGLSYGVDFAARDSATVGGSIATNAGGVRVLRHGDTRAQVLGIEAVLGTSEVVSHLGGLLKDNTGYHLPALLCGSEATLGIVTAARLRLLPNAHHRVAALLAFDEVADAIAATLTMRATVPGLDAAELFLADGLDLVCTVHGLPQPFDTAHSCYLLVETAGMTDPTDQLAEVVEQLDRLADVAVASDNGRRAQLWRYREAHTEAINTLGSPHKLDVSLPSDALAEFIGSVPASVRAVAAGAKTWLFGHAADGNIHVNVTGLAHDDDRVDNEVLQLVASLHGSISAEHGIGTAKKRWLHLSRSEAEIRTFLALKRALDPDGILNPNVLFP